MSGAKKQPDENEVFDASSKLKLDTAHEILQRPDKFAKLFCDAANKQVDIQNTIKKFIKDSLESDIQTRNALKGMIRHENKESWKAFMMSTGGKIGLGIWTIVTILLTVLAERYLGN
jgi:hypothetical protein